MSIDNDLFKRIYSSMLLHGIRMKRVDIHLPSVSPGGGNQAAAFGESELADIEAGHPDGLSTQQIVELYAARGEKLSEATFRKYVQQGLLPRSVRVGRKGKHRGSQGRYPSSVVRQIEAVRRLMAQGFTLQDIQSEFLCVRGDIDALARTVAQVLGTLSKAVEERTDAPQDDMLARSVNDARESADALVAKLRAIEQRLAMRARMARAAV
jgi:DNA-binding transcriptional MerR regulator